LSSTIRQRKDTSAARLHSLHGWRFLQTPDFATYKRPVSRLVRCVALGSVALAA